MPLCTPIVANKENPDENTKSVGAKGRLDLSITIPNLLEWRASSTRHKTRISCYFYPFCYFSFLCTRCCINFECMFRGLFGWIFRVCCLYQIFGKYREYADLGFLPSCLRKRFDACVCDFCSKCMRVYEERSGVMHKKKKFVIVNKNVV